MQAGGTVEPVGRCDLSNLVKPNSAEVSIALPSGAVTGETGEAGGVDSETGRTAAIAILVPATTPAGSYTMTLTCYGRVAGVRMQSGEQATAQLTVAGGPTTPRPVTPTDSGIPTFTG